MKTLLISADPQLREWMGLAVRSAARRLGEEDFQTLEARDGIGGLKVAWKARPEVVVADELASRAGAFAVARDLKGADPPFPGRVIVILERAQDEWLARWSGADAWFVKPVNPFELGDAVAGLLEAMQKESA